MRSCIAQERRDARFAEAKRLREQGMSIRAVAHALGVERKTVRRWLRAGQAPTWRRAMGGASILDPHRAYLEDRWRDGCRNAAALWRELCERGFSGQYGVVRDWGTHRRRQDLAANAPNPAGTVKPVKQPEPPTPRRTARLLTDAPEALSDDDRRFVAALRERSPVVAIASDLISRFAVMVKKRTPEGFNGWLREAERTARWRRLRPASGATRTRCALRCASPGAPVRSKGTSTG